MHRRQALTAITAGWGVLAGTAQAQNFPSRPLRLIVGYTAGGAVDIGEMLTATTEQWAAMLSSEKNLYEKLIREARISPTDQAVGALTALTAPTSSCRAGWTASGPARR